MTQHLPILSIMVLFLGAFLTVLFGSKNKVLRGIIVTASIVASSLFIALLIKPVMIDGQVISYWLGNWAPVNGYAIGIGIEVDQLNLFFAILVSLTVLLSGIYSFRYTARDDTLEKYYVLYLMLSGGVMGLVLSGDLFNMFVMIEIMTFAAVALTAFRNNSNGALEAAFKYLVIGSIGSSFVLTGTILLYSQLHTLNLAQMAALLAEKSNPTTIFAFALLFTGFSIKSFIVPFHPVAADAYMTAPASVSMLFSGMVNKAGVYGLIRLTYTVFQVMGLSSMQFIMVFLGTITMFVGVTMALSQHDFKRLLAFHSISQIGYVITAISLSTALGITGGLYHAMNHTLFKGLLFLCAGAVFYAAGTTDLDRLGGLAKKMPQTAAIFLIGAFSISGIPPFNGFVSKWLIYQATYEKAAETGNIGYALVTIIAVVVSVMTLASFIKVSQSVFFGQLPKDFENIKEAPLSMRIPMWIMAILCIVTGILPKFVSDYLLTPATNAVLNVGQYIDKMMGSGYFDSATGTVYTVPSANYALAGYWNPVSWLILFVVILAAFALFALLGKGSRGDMNEAPEPEDSKYDTFFGGEMNERSHVGGSDLFWGLRYNLRHYFGFMYGAHSGVVNDYALWAVCASAVIIVYMFVFI
ncbi:MAG: proton-conducting transporter membrane subunit [Oscillospiraceae bacterium]